MAAQRPVVLVFQEFATLSTTPATPDLNCLIAGPCYFIQDYPGDAGAETAGKIAAAYGVSSTADATGSAVVTSNLTVSAPPNIANGAVLDQDSLRLIAVNPVVELGFGSTMTTTDNDPVVEVLGATFVTDGVVKGDVLVMTDDTTTPGTPVTLVRTIVAVTEEQLTLNNETPATFADSGVKFRIQRTVGVAELDSSFLTLGAGNAFTVNGGATLPVGGSDLLVIAADIYTAYRALRTDLQDVQTVNSVSEITGKLGKIDARNPLAVGVSVALQNTNTPIQAFGIGTNDITGYTAMKDAIEGRSDVYAVVPLSTDVSVLTMLKASFLNLADPDYALTNGVPQKFRVAIGATSELPLYKTVIDEQNDGKTETFGSAPTTYHTLDLSTSVPAVNFITSNVQPGDTLNITVDAAGTTRVGSYVVSQVLSAKKLEVEAAIPGAVQTSNATLNIKVGATAVNRIASAAYTDVATAQDAALYLDLYDANGSFVDDGVMADDLVEMPRDPGLSGSAAFASSDVFTVATVISNQRLRIVDNGRNTSLVANELPHGVSRTDPSVLVSTSAILTYRIKRTLDKDGQVTELISVPQSIKSRRVVNVWPNRCDVTDLVDGSLPRASLTTTTKTAAVTQPGYYLACAVGGMTAGLPSHQGFTNLGIAGIKKLYNSNTYFSDKQISSLSNAGWFLFQQDTPQSLPYVVHQLTTDVESLQSGEFSMVKNFDFVSLFFVDILDQYIGVWNVNQETLGFIRAAVLGGVDNLTLRRRPRIGAPIISGALTKIEVSPSSADRVELYLTVQFPAPLNTIALHIVSA